MSRRRFESLLEERGFSKEKSKAVVNALQERQYFLAKSLLQQLDSSKAHQTISEDAVNQAAELLFRRRNVFSTKDREELASVNGQPLPEIRDFSGPSVDKQLKYVNQTSQQQPATTTSSAPKPTLLEVDEGPQDSTVFPSIKPTKGAVEFRNINEEGDSKKRTAEDANMNDEDSSKRIKI